MRRHVDFRNDLHVVALCRLLHERFKFHFGVSIIFGGCRFPLPVLKAGFEPHGLIGFEAVRLLAARIVFLQPNVIIVEVQLKVVHFIPGHVLRHIAQCFEGKGPAADIEHEPTHWVFGVVSDFTMGQARLFSTLPQNLQHGPRGPIDAVRVRRGEPGRRTERCAVALPAKKCVRVVQRQIKVALLRRIVITQGQLCASDLPVILLKFRRNGTEGLSRIGG